MILFFDGSFSQILDFYMCSTLNLHQQLLEQMMLMLRLFSECVKSPLCEGFDFANSYPHLAEKK
jgi:hypothetical protein